jgi:hypothetical protein
MTIYEIKKETEVEAEENKDNIISKTKDCTRNFFTKLGDYMCMHPYAYLFGCFAFGLILRIIICHFGGYDFWKNGFVKKDK